MLSSRKLNFRDLFVVKVKLIFFNFSEKKKSKSLMKDMSAVVISDRGTLYVADKTILVFKAYHSKK